MKALAAAVGRAVARKKRARSVIGGDPSRDELTRRPEDPLQRQLRRRPTCSAPPERLTPP
ncbi:hypothetical protein DIPPA_26646 [Diplonema papillatum]|nr:hypothetical protein DIPPA_26646 [Diplonema papillatum]